MGKSRQYYQNLIAKRLGFTSWSAYLLSKPDRQTLIQYSAEGYRLYKDQRC